MRKFIEDDFMLSCDAARGLYRDYAAPQPIVDFHSHLSPEEFALDRRWENITQVWLYGDHYKWRAMRGNGVPEEFITGGATDKEFGRDRPGMRHCLVSPELLSMPGKTAHHSMALYMRVSLPEASSR